MIRVFCDWSGEELTPDNTPDVEDLTVVAEKDGKTLTVMVNWRMEGPDGVAVSRNEILRAVKKFIEDGAPRKGGKVKP